MSKMAQFAYIYGIASPSPSWRMPPRGSGAGGNFSAVLHNDGDGGCSLPKSVDTGQIGFIDDIDCATANNHILTMTPFKFLVVSHYPM